MTLSSNLLLNERQAAEILGCKPNTLRTWRCIGIGPRFRKVGKRMVRYRLIDIQRFLRIRQQEGRNDI